jgi:hypothetical protein
MANNLTWGKHGLSRKHWINIVLSLQDPPFELPSNIANVIEDPKVEDVND